MALRFTLQLLVVADDDQQVPVDDLVVLDNEYDRPEQLDLTFAAAKAGPQPPSRRVPALSPAPRHSSGSRLLSPGASLDARAPGRVHASGSQEQDLCVHKPAPVVPEPDTSQCRIDTSKPACHRFGRAEETRSFWARATRAAL